MKKIQGSPKYLFFKQTAPLRSYFPELCLDVAGDEESIVFSDIEHEPIGALRFVTGPKYQRTSASQRFRTWSRYLWEATKLAFRTPGNPTLFIVAQPPFLPLLGYIQRKTRGRHYVLWIDDVWPDIIVGQGLRADSSWMVRLWRQFNLLTYRHADHVFTLGPYMRDKIKQYVPARVPVSVVPTWVDTDTIRPLPKSQNSFARQHHQVDKITVLYSGNLGLTHDIHSILDAARRLRDRTFLHFVIIGAGPQWESIKGSIGQHQDANITLLPLQPIEVFPFSLAAGDIALASIERGIEGMSMPSKTYYSLAAGSAMIGLCHLESDLAHVIVSNDCGVVVPPKDPDALAKVIDRIASNPLELRRMRENARRAAVDRYSRSINTAKVRMILRGGIAEHSEG